MMLRRCVVAMIFMLSPPIASAESLANFACTGEGAAKYETGLGSDVDDIVHVPSRLRSNMYSLKRRGWTYEYGDGAFTYRDKKRVTIRRGASPLNMTAQFSHEIGHANYAYREDLSSRDAYIRRACTDEGHGLVENIVAHRSMQTCAAEHLGIVSAEPDVLLAKYEDMVQRPPVNIPEIGYMFCERNRVPTGETYLDYYGGWYDANYGRTFKEEPVVSDPVLWDQVNVLARSGGRGGAALRAIWPMSAPAEGNALNVPPAGTWRGGAAKLSGTVAILSSEIRTDPDGNVVIAYADLGGRCVTRSEVQAHYPTIEITQIPRAHGPRSTVWSAFGEWGELMFTFEEDAPKCVGTISLDPQSQPDEA